MRLALPEVGQISDVAFKSTLAYARTHEGLRRRVVIGHAHLPKARCFILGGQVETVAESASKNFFNSPLLQ